MNNDSLSDGLEIGGWNISVYFEATGEKKRGYPIVVTSCPWTIDTDSDGLTDGQEFENATHPRSHDTDMDGMTDLWELTGPAPSDPCGIEGTPPNLSDLKVKTEEEWEVRWTGVGRLAIPMYVRVRNEINVTVTATDNVGLKWIRFHIDDKGEQKAYFTQNTNNSTVTMFFKHDLWSKWVSGYDLNITVSDVNGNEGYLEFHIDSALEAFVQWLIGAVTALAKFVMELASAAIAWIYNSAEKLICGIMDPIIVSANAYSMNLFISVQELHESYNKTSEFSEDSQDDFSDMFFSPFFYNIMIIIAVCILIISIVSYFAPMIAGLITAIMIIILSTIIAYFAYSALSENDEVSEDSMHSSNIPMSFDELISSITSIISGDDSNIHRINNEDLLFYIYLSKFIAQLILFAISMEFWLTALGGGGLTLGLIITITMTVISGFLLFMSTVYGDPFVILSLVTSIIGLIAIVYFVGIKQGMFQEFNQIMMGSTQAGKPIIKYPKTKILLFIILALWVGAVNFLTIVLITASFI